MKGWQITSKGVFEFIEREASAVGENEIKVRVTKSALTSTDTALYSGFGDYPIIPVRAATGVISEAPGNEFRKGERVLISPYINCAQQTKDHHNEQEKAPLFSDIDILGVHRDGFLRDFAVLPKNNVIPMPDGIGDEEAIFVEHIALALKTIEVLDIKQNEYAVIHGGNTICDFLAQLILYYHGIPIIVDSNVNLLNICKKNGIYYTINPTETDCMERVFEITGGKMAEYVIFDSRTRVPATSALSLSRKKGKVALMGFYTFADKIDINIAPLLKKQLTFIGINNGYNEIPAAANILANKVLKFNSLISHRLTLDEAPEVIKDMTANPLNYRSVLVNNQ